MKEVLLALQDRFGPRRSDTPDIPCAWSTGKQRKKRRLERETDAALGITLHASMQAGIGWFGRATSRDFAGGGAGLSGKPGSGMWMSQAIRTAAMCSECSSHRDRVTQRRPRWHPGARAPLQQRHILSATAPCLYVPRPIPPSPCPEPEPGCSAIARIGAPARLRTVLHRRRRRSVYAVHRFMRRLRM
jgi:hypothetical protein